MLAILHSVGMFVADDIQIWKGSNCFLTVADAVFYIQQGKIKLNFVSEQGKEAVVAILGPGHFFGEGCLNGHPLRIATTRAVDECVGKTVRCAISTAAMDDLEGKHDVRADQRVDQFVRLRDAIEERASRKFSERPIEAQGPVVLRSNDFFR